MLVGKTRKQKWARHDTYTYILKERGFLILSPEIAKARLIESLKQRGKLREV